MFNNDMILTGIISDVGGPSGLIPGMILGEPMKDEFTDGKYHIEHVGVFSGYIDNGKGELEPMVYSFNTDTNRGNLSPLSKNTWIYYGWHYRVALDSN